MSEAWRAEFKRAVPMSREKKNPVNEYRRVTSQSIETARSLARGLLPRYGKPAARRRHAGARWQKQADLYGLEVKIARGSLPGISLSENDASHLYASPKRALTNAARHGHATWWTSR